MQENRKELIGLLTLLVVLGLLYTHPVYDPDFWWHLRGGEWIWKNLSIPVADTFSFTTYNGTVSPADEIRTRYILSQYWLSQPVFYLSWRWLGPLGVILLRAGLLLLSVFALFRFLIRKKTEFSVALSLSALTGLHLAIFTGERPQLFSFLFSVLFLSGIEYLRAGEGEPKTRQRLIFLLPLLTLVWANMHSSAMVAWIIGLPYLIYFLHRQLTDRQEQRKWRNLTIIVGISLAITLLNPNTYHGFFLTFNLFQSKHLSMNTEFMSPFLQMKDMRLIYPSYLILLVVTAFMIFSRHALLLHRVLTVIFLGMSLTAMRFTPFFVLLAPMLIGPGLQQAVSRSRRRVEIVLIILAAAACLLQLSQSRSELLTQGVNHGDFPQQAVKFLKVNNPQGHMFNLFEWGGYLQWHLPEKKTFIDSRALRLAVYEDYDAIIAPSPVRPLWRDLLDTYRIDIILISGVRSELVYMLLKDPDWEPVYADQISVIFLRKPHNLVAVPAAVVLEKITESLSRLVSEDPENITWIKRLAAAYYHRKDYRNALLFYQKALALSPDDPYLLQMTGLLKNR
ncbi:MAG: hypothetical protein HZA15_16290 [Nitrospirae bacterium]|nr:hypothetical protein [Nitrospirota bacterium]